LGIEIDGETHLGKRNVQYDKIRTEELEKLGIKILRFWNKDITEGLNEVENIIENNLTPLPPFQRGAKGGYPPL
jgi:very-short-patch-repair endonuclease